MTARGKEVTVRFTGRRTDKLPLTVRLPNRAGARKVVKITSYPGAGNHYLAVKIGSASEAVAVNGLRLVLRPARPGVGDLAVIRIKVPGAVPAKRPKVVSPRAVAPRRVTVAPGVSVPAGFSCRILAENEREVRVAIPQLMKATIPRDKIASIRFAKQGRTAMGHPVWVADPERDASYSLRWENVGKKPLAIRRDMAVDLYDRVFVRGPDGKLIPARQDNRKMWKSLSTGHKHCLVEPGKPFQERFDPWRWVVRPAAPGEYTLWVEFEVKGVPARSKTPAALVGAREWIGKVRSNGVKVRIAGRTLEVVKLAGTKAALALAEKGKVEIQNYLRWKRDNPAKAWTPRKLSLKGMGALEAEDAVLLYGHLLVARSSDKLRGVRGVAEPSSDPRVQVLRGVIMKDGKEIPCFMFKASVEVKGGTARCSVRLIVRLPGGGTKPVKKPAVPARPGPEPPDPPEVF